MRDSSLHEGVGHCRGDAGREGSHREIADGHRDIAGIVTIAVSDDVGENVVPSLR